jgi:tetratricopeptide (TPR) repeat protein/tRNA A-37 threonylcarbamoyl transferase component Bud32
MGAVFRAVRDDDQFQKTVAIKMLRFADGDPAMLQRFRHERQILASLEHPHIARLLDGGAWIPPGSAEPQPYLVMEYVEGVPLTTYCEQQRLSTAQRLELFRNVCDALSYAHRQLVVHRDVKPGNILVTADGTPKLLDFGVSKLLNPEREADADTVTMTIPALTPDYASPEQVRGETVSTLTDVYSLGAVLYELLTGRRPYHLATHDPLEIAREICEREVAPPRVNTELDLIVLKAMQKEPGRRYQSVEQFTEDIRRYLEGLPIIARPDTLSYRTAKFARRHWVVLADAATLLAVLVGGIGVSTWEARRADTEAATAKAVNEFLQNDLLAQAGAHAQAGPNHKPDPDLKVRTALERAAAGISRKFSKKPLVEASIRETIGAAYQDLGLYPEAQQQFEGAFELRRRTLSVDHPDVLRGMSALADLYVLQGKYGQARPLLTSLLGVQRRLLGREHRDTLKTMADLGELFSYEGDDVHAERSLADAMEAQSRTLGPEHPDTLDTMDQLGAVYRIVGKYTLAERLLSKTVEIRTHISSAEHPNTLESQYELGVVYLRQGKYPQAESLFTKVAESYRRTLGEEHPFTITVLNGLVGVYRGEGRYVEGEALERYIVDLRRRVLGPDHPDTLSSLYSLAEFYRREGKYDLAERSFDNVVGSRLRLLGARHRDTAASLCMLGRVRIQQKKYAEAEPPLRRAMSIYDQLNLVFWGRYDNQSLLGASLAGQKKYAEAEPLLLGGYRRLREEQNTIPADSPFVLEDAGERILQLYHQWDKPDQAAQWRKEINTAKQTSVRRSERCCPACYGAFTGIVNTLLT